MSRKSGNYPAQCPKCEEPKTLRKVIYGLPEKMPDKSKYVLGGCCISDRDPEYICIKCGWEYFKENNLGIMPGGILDTREF